MTSADSTAILARLLDLHPKTIDLTLDRMWRLLDALGNPQDSLPPVVHVAGTNGKGSTVAMLRAGLEAAGQRVHVYTSPHLVRFHERIRVAGELIGEDALVSVLQDCERANAGQIITFFEITTAAALLAFARTPADVALIEVGLGGRLDATNVFDRPALTVITPVSIDHQQFLGDTLPEIAGEKAGILKKGVPCVVAAQEDDALQVIEDRAAMVGAPLLIHGQDWVMREEHGRLAYQDDRALLDLDPPGLIGAHQVINAGTAVATMRALNLDDHAIQAGMTGVEWPGRIQRLHAGRHYDALGGSALWVDGSHNASAGAALGAVLADWARSDGPIHLITGMLKSKAASEYLRPLAPFVAGLQAVAIPGTQGSYDAETMAAIARAEGIAAEAQPSLADAVSSVARQGAARVIVCGSLYLVGAFLAENAGGT